MKYIDADQLKAEIERLKSKYRHNGLWTSSFQSDLAMGKIESMNELLSFLDTLQEQPVSDHHEIEVEFRGEKVTISREFYRDGERNYSTSEQDDNAIWSALRAWCEKKGITPFELYPKQSEQPVIKKSNALFDKCVENCDPVVMKEVSDNIDKMLGRQPVEGLEEEIKLYYSDNFAYISSDQPTLSILTNIARHFAEWGAEHLRDTTKMIPDGLEEELKRYISSDEYINTRGNGTLLIARHFAEWQKVQDQKTIELAEDHAMLAGMNKMEQQMMEKAVETSVYGCGDEMIPEIVVELSEGYKPGDKVRVIVIKEDEK